LLKWKIKKLKYDFIMLEAFEQHFALRKEKPKPSEEIKEKSALALAKEIQEIQERMKKEGKTIEGYQRIIALVQEIKKIYKKEIIGWQKEGKLTEKDVLAEYPAGGTVRAANFSPEGDKVVIGSGGGDNMMRVISLKEKDKEGKPRVLAEYKAGGWVWAANFSPEGDKVVIGSEDGMMRVIG
jgi:DNA gyrase/topoisomerase IV subunit A